MGPYKTSFLYNGGHVHSFSTSIYFHDYGRKVRSHESSNPLKIPTTSRRPIILSTCEMPDVWLNDSWPSCCPWTYSHLGDEKRCLPVFVSVETMFKCGLSFLDMHLFVWCIYIYLHTTYTFKFTYLLICICLLHVMFWINVYTCDIVCIYFFVICKHVFGHL